MLPDRNPQILVTLSMPYGGGMVDKEEAQDKIADAIFTVGAASVSWKGSIPVAFVELFPGISVVDAIERIKNIPGVNDACVSEIRGI